MPNGGESGRQLDRLQDQVDATRADLTDVAGAVSGLRELVTELVRRSGSEHREDRWQARLGTLETRLGMMETTIRSEVERMRAAAGAVDALADEFRSTVGDTQSLVGLASEIGSRLDVLEGLERQVRGAAQDVASSVADRLDHEASDREQRDRALGDRITETIADSRRAVGELADRLDAISRATAELPALEDRITTQVREASRWDDAFARLSADVGAAQQRLADAIGDVTNDLVGLRSDLESSNESGRRATIDALGVLSTELAAFEGRLSAGARDAQIDEIHGSVAQLRTNQPQLSERVEHVSSELGALRSALAAPLASVDTIAERVDALGAALRAVAESQPDPRPQLDTIASAIDTLREAQPDIEEVSARLSAEIGALRTAQPDYRDSLQELRALVAAIPTQPVDPSDDLSRLAAEIAELRAAQPDPRDALDRITAEIAELRATQPDPRDALDRITAELAELRAAQPDPRDALDRITAELAELRAAQPDPRDDLSRLAGEIAELRATQPRHSEQLQRLTAIVAALPTDAVDPSDALSRLAAEVNELRVNQPDHSEALQRLTAVVAALRTEQVDPTATLERLATELAELRATQPDYGEQLQRLTAIVSALPSEPIDPRDALSQLSAQVAELRMAQPNFDESLRGLRESIAALPTEQADYTETLRELRTAIAALPTELSDPTDALTHLTARVDALGAGQPDVDALVERLRSEIRGWRDSLPDATGPAQAAVELLADQAAVLADLRAVPPVDLGPLEQRIVTAADELRAELVQLRATQPELRVDLDPVMQHVADLGRTIDEQFAALRERPEPALDLGPVLARIDDAVAQLAQLRAEQPVTDAIVGRLAAMLTAQSEVLSQLQSAQPQVSVRLDHLATDILELADRQQASAITAARLDELTAGLTDLAQAGQPEVQLRLDRVQAEIGDLRTLLPDPDAVLAPMTERLDRITEEIGRLHDPEPALTTLAGELSELRAAQVDPALVQNFLADRLDRVLAEIAALRADQPDPAAAVGVVAPLVDRVEQVARAVDALREDVRNVPPPAVDVEGALEPLNERLAAIHAHAATTATGVTEFEGQLARSNMQIDELATAISELRAVPDRTDDAMAPLVDRLAIVIDTVSSMHGDVTGLADALASARVDRSQLANLADDTNTRLDLLAAALTDLRNTPPDLSATNAQVQQLASAVADLRDSRPDFTSSFVAITELVQALQAGVTETRNRIDELHEGLQTTDARAEMAAVVDPIIERLDSIAARAAITEAQIGTTLDDLADSVTRFDSEQAESTRTHIDELRQAVHALGDRQANALMDVVQRFEQVSANAAATQEAIRAIDSALAAPRDDMNGERIGELGQQVASLTADVRSSVRSVVGLGADLTALRSAMETLTVAIPDAGENEAAIRAAVASIDTAMADRDQQMRDFIDRLDEAVAGRDADVRDALSRLSDAISSAADAQDISSVTAEVGTGLANLRHELQEVREAASRTDVLDLVRNLSARDPEPAVQGLNNALRDVRADVHSTRSELQSMSRSIDELRDELRHTDEMAGGAGAALVASAATAMARLEARMDSEFDSVGRQMEALGTLLGQVIDSVHRVEAQVIGVHPMSERVRSSAASVLDSLRTNVRQRSTHRQGGPPPELGSGPSY